MELEPGSPGLREVLELIDFIEAAFESCKHPFAQGDAAWCNICGARRMGVSDVWLKPHWRDVIVHALFPKREG